MNRLRSSRLRNYAWCYGYHGNASFRFPRRLITVRPKSFRYPPTKGFHTSRSSKNTLTRHSFAFHHVQHFYANICKRFLLQTDLQVLVGRAFSNVLSRRENASFRFPRRLITSRPKSFRYFQTESFRTVSAHTLTRNFLRFDVSRSTNCQVFATQNLLKFYLFVRVTAL